MGNQTENKKIKIAFDLDGVIIDKPPLIPKSLLEKLFRGCKNNRKLHYRFPKSKLEIFIRKLSHFYLFRPPIKKNIEFIKELAKDKRYELYVVSARYSFLLPETKKWFSQRGVNGLFKQCFLNLNDEQPHQYKEKVLNKLKPDYFIDDDLAIVDYLKGKITATKIFFYQRSSSLSLKEILKLD